MTMALNPEMPFKDVVAVILSRTAIVPGDVITVDFNHSEPHADNIKFIKYSCDAVKKCRRNKTFSLSNLQRKCRRRCDKSLPTARDMYEDILIKSVHGGQIDCPYDNCNQHFFHSSTYYDHLGECHGSVDPTMPSGKSFLHDFPCKICGHQSKGPFHWARHDLICKSTLQCGCTCCANLTQRLGQGSDSSGSTSESEDDECYVPVDVLSHNDKNETDCADKPQQKSRKVLVVDWKDIVEIVEDMEDTSEESKEKVQTETSPQQEN